MCCYFSANQGDFFAWFSLSVVGLRSVFASDRSAQKCDVTAGHKSPIRVMVPIATSTMCSCLFWSCQSPMSPSSYSPTPPHPTRPRPVIGLLPICGHLFWFIPSLICIFLHPVMCACTFREVLFSVIVFCLPITFCFWFDFFFIWSNKYYSKHVHLYAHCLDWLYATQHVSSISHSTWCRRHGHVMWFGLVSSDRTLFLF